MMGRTIVSLTAVGIAPLEETDILLSLMNKALSPMLLTGTSFSNIRLQVYKPAYANVTYQCSHPQGSLSFILLGRLVW
jgi:hypothetical protein